MISLEQYNHTMRVLPILQRADPQLAHEFQQAATFARIPAGRDVFIEGDRVDGIALLISGVVRVYKIEVNASSPAQNATCQQALCLRTLALCAFITFL